MKPFTTPLRLLTLPAWRATRPPRDRRDPGPDTVLDSGLWEDTEPNRPPAQGGQAVPLSRTEIEMALDAGTQRHFPPRGESEVMRGH